MYGAETALRFCDPVGKSAQLTGRRFSSARNTTGSPSRAQCCSTMRHAGRLPQQLCDERAAVAALRGCTHTPHVGAFTSPIEAGSVSTFVCFCRMRTAAAMRRARRRGRATGRTRIRRRQTRHASAPTPAMVRLTDTETSWQQANLWINQRAVAGSWLCTTHSLVGWPCCFAAVVAAAERQAGLLRTAEPGLFLWRQYRFSDHRTCLAWSACSRQSGQQRMRRHELCRFLKSLHFLPTGPMHPPR